MDSDTKELIAAAKAVIARWDSPDWKDGTHTADYIDRLRRAVVASEGLCPRLAEQRADAAARLTFYTSGGSRVMTMELTDEQSKMLTATGATHIPSS